MWIECGLAVLQMLGPSYMYEDPVLGSGSLAWRCSRQWCKVLSMLIPLQTLRVEAVLAQI